MKHKEIIFILASMFILVIAWIVFNIYHNSATSTIPESVVMQIAPITPAFDLATIEKLKSRNKIEPVLEIQKNPQEEESAGNARVVTNIEVGNIELPILTESDNTSSQSASQSAEELSIP